jgi:hypothetical protein
VSYLRSSCVVNFLGFFGQHSHMKKSLTPMGAFPGSLHFGGEASCRLSLRRCVGRDMDPRGEVLSEVGGWKGELQLFSDVIGDMATGDIAPGDRRPKEE